MKNGRTELLRDIASAKELVCLYHYIPERKDKERKVIKVQKNGVVKTSAGFLDLPQATLIFYNWHEKEFTVYDMGTRPLREEEQKLLDEMYSLCTDEEQERDMMTDGSMCYWREKRFRENHTIGNMSMETWYNKRLCMGSGEYTPVEGSEKLKVINRVVRDPKIQGRKLYTFKLIF